MKLINKKIIDDLTESLGLDLFPEKEESKMLGEVLEVISKRAGLRIVEDLSEAEMDEFEKIPKDDLDEMENFLLAKNPKTESIFAEEAEKVKEEMLSYKKEG